MEKPYQQQFNYYKQRGFNSAFAVLSDNEEFLLTPVKIIADDQSTKKCILELLHSTNVVHHAKDTFLAFEVDFSKDQLQPNLVFDFKFRKERFFYLS
jgi:hypothetical protein